MAQVSIIGLDLAKNVFQVHGIDAQGKIVVRRAELLAFFAKLSPCLVGMEACGTATTGRVSCRSSAIRSS